MNVRPIPSTIAKRVVSQKHYLHRAPPVSFCYGLFEADIMGVICFGVPASHHLRKSACPSDPSKVIELNRLWVDDVMPHNTESWFISRALKLLPPLIVVSYADSGVHHTGCIYRATNFNYAGWTDMDRKTPKFDVQPATPDVDLLGVVRQRHSRDTSRRDVETVRVPRSKKFKYWITTGNRKERKMLSNICAWPRLEWATA